jgi:hypothetical protein
VRFPGVPIYVQAPEYEPARQPDYSIPEWVDFEGAEYAVVDGDTRGRKRRARDVDAGS